MSKRPGCYGRLMENINNPNCDTCWCRIGCLKLWNKLDKVKQESFDAQMKALAGAPLSKIFKEEELCLGKCEREVEE